MNINVIKTLKWSECGALLTSLAREYLAPPETSQVNDFAEFIRAHSGTSCKQMDLFLQKHATKLLWDDHTLATRALEDACLFSTQPASALGIILRHLEILNTGGKVPALWCFLDDEQKAVIHFINNGGWYAEAFFDCPEDFSVLHLMKNDEAVSFVPVVFTRNLASYACLAEADGAHFLQDYLPREVFQFLSNKSGKKKTDTAPPKTKSYTVKDSFDLL